MQITFSLSLPLLLAQSQILAPKMLMASLLMSPSVNGQVKGHDGGGSGGGGVFGAKPLTERHAFINKPGGKVRPGRPLRSAGGHTVSANRIVRLKKLGNAPLGFSIRGGKCAFGAKSASPNSITLRNFHPLLSCNFLTYFAAKRPLYLLMNAPHSLTRLLPLHQCSGQRTVCVCAHI